MGVEDWLGEWVERNPPLDLLEGGLRYACGLVDGEEEEEEEDRQSRRGTALERLVVHRTFASLLGPLSRGGGGGGGGGGGDRGGGAFLQACRLVGKWSR